MLRLKPNSPADETEILGLLPVVDTLAHLLRRVSVSPFSIWFREGRWAVEPPAMRARLLG
jgi:hypothetical protein